MSRNQCRSWVFRDRTAATPTPAVTDKATLAVAESHRITAGALLLSERVGQITAESGPDVYLPGRIRVRRWGDPASSVHG